MKRIFRLRNIAILMGTILFIVIINYLFTDAFFNRKFRTLQAPINSAEQVDLRGLSELKASGSAIVHFLDLKIRLRHVKGNKLIVDAMKEPHGYINSIPTSFLGYTAARYTWRYAIRRLLLTGTTEVCTEKVVPESEEAKKNGFSYVTLSFGSRFLPTNEKIDEIIKILEELPENTWVHFHCHHGKGRTSLMLAMLDIVRNAPTVSLEDILKRQRLLGSENLLDTTVWVGGSYTKEELVRRLNYITEFYAFVVQRKAGGIQFWSEWKDKQKNEGV